MNAKGLLKLLWTSNSFTAPSGYGQQTALWLARLVKAGYDVALASNYGLMGAPFMTPDGIVNYPAVTDSALNDIIVGHFQHSQSDVCISLYDPHPFKKEAYGQFPWCAWTPSDCVPLHPGNKIALSFARWIWSMSKFGDAQIRLAGFQNVTYVPHGINTSVFRPIPQAESRARLQPQLGVDFQDKFVVMCNAANKGMPSRKGFYETFAAFKAFCDIQPNSLMYMHSEAMGAFNGENLIEIMRLVNLDPQKVAFVPQYQLVTGMLSPEYMADCYNAADVFLSTSHGEGFGIPVVEAQACGTPIVAPDNSALSELNLTGRKVKCTTYMPVTGVTWERPDIGETVQGLLWTYEHRNDETLHNETRIKALAYEADIVFEKHMKPAIEAIQADVYKPIAPQQVLRKRRNEVKSSNGVVHEEKVEAVA